MRLFIRRSAYALIRRLIILKPIAFALLHIAKEQGKVFVAYTKVLRRFVISQLHHGFDHLLEHKLTFTIYSLLATFVVKIGAIVFSTLGLISSGGVFFHLLDGLLVLMVLGLLYLLRPMILPLMRMEQQGDQDIVEFGDDFGKLLSLQTAIDSLPEAFVLWGRDKKMVSSNRKFRELYHLVDDCKHEAKDYYGFKNGLSRVMMKSVKLGKDFSGANYHTQMRDGRWLHVTEQPTIDGGLVSISFDVTKLKSSQQNLAIREQQMRSTVGDLRASRRELERKTQKLAELADKYMREKDRAEEANRVKSEFLANISHELRTPLNAIIGFSDMMQRKVLGPVDNPQYAQYINDIHMSGSYLLELINDILDMSRIEAGRLILETSPCHLNSLVEECFNIVLPQATENEIVLHKSIPSDVTVTLDHRAIKQVLLNLMSNAIKFTEQGGHVDLSVEKSDSYVSITVADTGIGIESSALNKLGRPFVQAENQLTKCHSGTGLGLAISKSLIDLHGGTLLIESEVGVGTRVSIELPMDTPQPKDKPSVRSIAA